MDNAKAPKSVNQNSSNTDQGQGSTMSDSQELNKFQNIYEKGIEDASEKIDKMMNHIVNGGIGADLANFSQEELEQMYYLAYTLYQGGTYEQARLMFSHLVTYNHLDKRFVIGLASAHYMLKQYEDALFYYLSIHTLDKNDPSAFYYSGDCYFKLHNYKNAKDFYQKAKLLIKEQGTEGESIALEEALNKKLKIIQALENSKNHAENTE